ncbi:hypothetical protein NDU88_004569 [Pleurodeles waltl]|uniref:Uncharacterized protein n=1 Tax=Pleurodeles waltl TaxID=8319 RepID=A0AAV7W9D9_PLEWA|nr:hypothetical protein NDU88_004569 [Pleurodeles waltl]
MPVSEGGPGGMSSPSCGRWGAPVGERAQLQPQAEGGRLRPARTPGPGPHAAGVRPRRGPGPVRHPREGRVTQAGCPGRHPQTRSRARPLATRAPVRGPLSQGTASPEDAALESRVQGNGSPLLQVILGRQGPGVFVESQGGPRGPPSPMLLQSRSLRGQDNRSSEPGPRPRPTSCSPAGPMQDQLSRV